MNELDRIVLEIGRVLRALEKNAASSRAEQRAIEADHDLTTEQKQIKSRRASANGQRRYRDLCAELERQTKRAEGAAKETLAKTPVGEDAFARVRSLTKQRIADNLIIEQAVKVGDADVLEALRRERQWHNDGKSFREADETIRACTAALAKVGRHEGQRDDNEALVKLAEMQRNMPDIAEYAGKVVHGTDSPHDTLRFAYATGAGRDSDA